MMNQPIDWLNRWVHQNAQREVIDQALGQGSSLHRVGATQIRFMLHALQDKAKAVQLTALQDHETNEHWPILINQQSGVAWAYPGAREVSLDAEAQADSRDQLEFFPDADPALFQALMNAAAADESFHEFYQALHAHRFPSVRPTREWFDGSHSLADIRQAMQWHFGCDEALGAQREPGTGDTVLPCGGTFSRCTNSAHMTAREFGGVVTGFLVRDNPSVTNEEVEEAGGHDFTVINSRYVVDLWIGIYTGATGPDGRLFPCVYDLLSNDPDEKALNQAIYGYQANWSVLEDYSPEGIPKQQTEGDALMSSKLNLDLVPYDVEIENDRHLAIKGCGGSSLAKLNNDPEVTGNRFSDELKYCIAETDGGALRAYEVSYSPDDEGTLYFTPCDGAAPSVGEVAGWISSAYDRIESIESAALLDADELDSAMNHSPSLTGPG